MYFKISKTYGIGKESGDFSIFTFFSVAIYLPVQSPREGETTKMVQHVYSKRKEENNERLADYYTCSKTQNVQFSGI